MPNRIIKESINESRGLTCCTFFAQDLYKRLITYADDYGRFNADPQIMLARLYPRELDVVSLDDIMDGIIELTGVEKISQYTSEPREDIYGCFPNWGEHQRLRNSKRGHPEPTDTAINDWYLRRHVPMSMKIEVVTRDGFKCQICNKHIGAVDDPSRMVKMGAGLFHIDHIVPCGQGGRATLENLRLTCPRCNQSRKKRFTFEEIVEFAATRRNSPQLAARIQSNPIQSESESESESESISETREAGAVAPCRDLFAEFWAIYPKKTGRGAAEKAWKRSKVGVELHTQILQAVEFWRGSDQWQREGGQYIPNPARWLSERRWEDERPTQTQNVDPRIAALEAMKGCEDE